MIIADHHKPGHWRSTGENAYTPTCAWPENCYVQWGAAGVVLSRKGSYATAFFEAFPKDNAGGFIRGEGATISEAEAAAFKQWQRQVGCAHRWCRKGYLNGGGFCANCGAFKTMFESVYIIGAWKKPITPIENQLLDMPGYDEASRRYRRNIAIRKKLFGVATDHKPESILEEVMQKLTE